jgi:Ala-tRNA(Pro) deacylase
VPYEILPHREAFTARQVAQSTHVAGRLLAKVVVVHESTGVFLMAVVPADEHVDLGTLTYMTGWPLDRLATEHELKSLFPDCEVGAMPPFGRLYDMPMYVDTRFHDHDEIYFQAGNHHEVVRMSFDDFRKAAGPFSGEYLLHSETG